MSGHSFTKRLMGLLSLWALFLPFDNNWCYDHYYFLPGDWILIYDGSEVGVKGYQSIWQERKDAFDSKELLLWHGVLQQIDGDKVIVLFVTTCIETSG